MQDGGKGRLSSTLRRASMMLPSSTQQDFRVGFAEGSAASPGTAAREELLGGELIVKIEDATVSFTSSASDVRTLGPAIVSICPEGRIHYSYYLAASTLARTSVCAYLLDRCKRQLCDALEHARQPMEC